MILPKGHYCQPTWYVSADHQLLLERKPQKQAHRVNTPPEPLYRRTMMRKSEKNAFQLLKLVVGAESIRWPCGTERVASIATYPTEVEYI